MEHQIKNKSRDLPAHSIGRRRLGLGNRVLDGLAFASLLLTSSTLFAAETTVELSPLIYKSTLVAPVDGNKQIGVVLALPSSDPAGLTAFAKHVSRPGDPLFRQYITPQQFAERFGANESDYTALKTWADANGLAVSQESIARTSLTVRGSVSQFQRLFKTQLNTYRADDGQTFYSAGVKPTVPVEIAAKISGVIGLTAGKSIAQQSKIAKVLGEEPPVRSDKMRSDTAGGTGPGGTYSCTDLRTIYNIPNWGRLEKGMIVAVFEQGYYHPTDVEKYFQKFGVGKGTKQTAISVDQSPIVVETNIEPEACLDIDMLVGMNPNIAEVKVFIDDENYDPFPVAMVDAFQAMADDGTPQIISVSYGEDEGYFGNDAETAEDTVLQQLTTEGITVFASSGDDGAYGDLYNYGYNVADPCADPYVTAVGGTSLFTGPHDSFENEITWNELPNYGASGGGISSFWPFPDYAVTPEGLQFSFNGGSTVYRDVPDVSAVADPLTGVGIYVKDEGGWIQIGGTSVSCPIWAGYMSTVSAGLNWSGLGHLGFFNPILYRSLSYFNGPDPVFDVLSGTNGCTDYPYPYGYPGYTAGGGPDLCTGCGSIIGGELAVCLLTSQNQSGTGPGAFTLALQGKPLATSAKVNWTASSGTNAYAIQLWYDPYGNLAAGGVLLQTNLLPSGSTSSAFKNLVSNTFYAILLYSYNSAGSNSSFVEFQTAKK
jgi:subtilase family serine protease